MPRLSRRNAVQALGLLVAGAALPAKARAADAAPLAIQGYDPVAYFTLGAPARGRPELDHDWDEQRYLFARPEHRDLFKADPARYAPQFAGVCAMALTRGEIDEPNPEYWLVSDGKLYLFGKPIGPALFRKDLADNLAKAARNQPLIVRR
jgi:hypothetical protein